MTRIGVASILQETNTFSPLRCTLADFEAQGLYEGEEMRDRLGGTNTEAAGALEALGEAGVDAVPLLRAWAMSSGRVTAGTLAALCERLRHRLDEGGPLDGLVLSLHGAMAAEGADHADHELLRSAREAVGPDVPIGVCLDLHANVTPGLVGDAAFVVGYRTYPHVDMAATGARTARLLLDLVEERSRPVTALARRPMLTPPEAQGPDGPLGALRAQADALEANGAIDVSLFPVQPWLDVEGLGSAVAVTTDADREAAGELAEAIATALWDVRADFAVDLWPPEEALARARRSASRPVLLSESADSPTAGATADSPATVDALIRHGEGLRALTTLVDAPAVAACRAAGRNATVSLVVGCTLDPRFHERVPLAGLVVAVGEGPFPLKGPVFTGTQYSMGAWAVVESGSLSVLLTERPAPTFDPECYRHAGLASEQADVVVVRSATLFRAGWADLFSEALVLDLPGASTPRLDTLELVRAPRPLYPLDV
jgi:microcystin degradation protein MlrC